MSDRVSSPPPTTHRGAGRSADDLEAAVDHSRALTHAVEAEAFERLVAVFDPDAVVFDAVHEHHFEAVIAQVSLSSCDLTRHSIVSTRRTPQSGDA